MKVRKLDISVIVISLIISWFNWDIIDILTVFIEPIVVGAWTIIFIAFAAWALLNVVRKGPLRGCPTAGLYILVIFFHFFISTNSNKIDVDFFLNSWRREQVIAKLDAGETFIPAQHNFDLR